MTAKDGAAALANADDYSSYDQGMCLQYVRGPCWGVGSFYPSAIDAWNGAARKHPGDRNPPVGAPMFYRGGTYGHIVISRGEGRRMRSTDCTTSTRVNNADDTWPETAWGDDYLGWTEDLNGVDLPLDLGEDGEGDDMPQYDHASTGKAQKLTPDEWVAVVWQDVAAGPAFDEGSKTADLAGRKYSAVVHATFDAPEGATIRIRCVEVAGGDTVETDPQTEFLATGGLSYPAHVQNGGVANGRAFAVRVSCSQAATLTAADICVLSW